MKIILSVLTLSILFSYKMVAQSLETDYCTSINLPIEQIDEQFTYSKQEFLNGFITKKVMEIMKRLGLNMNFIIRENNNVKVAKASYINSTRYIDINQAFFHKISASDTETNMIIAHEIGHHLNFDLDLVNSKTFKGCYYRKISGDCIKWQEKELAADSFSGTAMFMLGAKRKICEILISKLLKDQYNSDGPQTHPNAQRRLKGFWKGYNQAENLIKELIDNDKITAEYYRNEALTTAYDSKESLTKNVWGEILGFYNKALVENPTLPLLYAERGYFHTKNLEQEAAIIDIDKALELDPDNPDFYFLAKEVKSDNYLLEKAAIDLKYESSNSIKKLEKEVKFN